jgi:hypothetical protein
VIAIEFDFLLRSDKGFSKHCKFGEARMFIAFERQSGFARQKIRDECIIFDRDKRRTQVAETRNQRIAFD